MRENDTHIDSADRAGLPGCHDYNGHKSSHHENHHDHDKNVNHYGLLAHVKGEQHYYLKDESRRNYHWCLIRTLHNYPFLTDFTSISNFPLNK